MGRLSALKKAAEYAYQYGLGLKPHKFRTSQLLSPEDLNEVREFERQIEEIVNMLEEIRSEAETTMLASFSNNEELKADSATLTKAY